MQRHQALKTFEQVKKEQEQRHKNNEPFNPHMDEGLRTCSCNPDKPFYSLCEFWRHQAEEYERLMEHYSHLFAPKSA